MVVTANGSVTHAYLGSNAVSLSEQLGIAVRISGTSGEILSVIDSTFYRALIKKFYARVKTEVHLKVNTF
jgi:hypothetical protein